MRHGEAVDGHGCPDAHRYLTAAGRETSRAVAVQLRELGHAPTHIYTSPLVRAVQTAELLAQTVGTPGPTVVVHAPLSPSGTTAQALSVLERHDTDDVVALVTHEPTVRSLAGHLSGLGGAFPRFRTSGVAVMSFDDSTGRLLGRFDPDAMDWREPTDLNP